MEHASILSPAVVLNIPVIANLVLQNLSAKSLNTCSRVCSTWNTIAKSLKQRRKSMSCFFADYDEDESLDGLAAEIMSAVQDLRTEPSVLFMYCTSQLFEQQIPLPTRHQMRHPRASKCMLSSVGDLMRKVIPKTCKLLAASSDGIVGTSKDLKRTAEVESELALTCLFLPHVEGVEFFTFNVDIYNYANQMDETHSGLTYLTELSTVPPDKEVKAVFFFCDEPFCPPEIGYSLLQLYDGAVIAGGYVDNLITSDPDPHDPASESGSASMMCVALCGPQVRVASVVIKEDIHRPEEVERILKQLKDCNLPEERSYAFMFACLGRGKGHYGSENVESSVFRKMFPKTPLLGFFGNGEIGFNFLQKYQTETSDMTCDNCPTYPSHRNSTSNNVSILGGMTKPLPKLYHAYTTIVCMVSLV
ncbi:F-box only protein 22-like [Mizuhopecten yessoensis]|uniref:F-box only protein 22 n=1 Tax=Mizuhopecten yessoensis TaxID=6573 RepID=A0A210QI56_MIZYE|nr:F-box only protein 22-like [Mizuhopecten yessoensis]OWF48422.1 F-box only protein 22 [Mizuhopecten yessoensis]